MHFLPYVQPDCPDSVKERCNRLDNAPYVCNEYEKKISRCTIAHKYTYNARFADRKYWENLKDSHSGINMTRQKLHKKDKLVSPLINQGQSPYQILTNHPELNMSVRTLYTYLDQRLFTARNIDLKRTLSFKPRKCHRTQITDRSVFLGKNIRRFLRTQSRPSRRNGYRSFIQRFQKNFAYLLFLQRKSYSFLMNRCTKGTVRLVFDHLKTVLEPMVSLLCLNIC